MVQRINFTGENKYALTYRNMAMVVGAWLLLCIVVQLGLSFHTRYVLSTVSHMKERIRVLQSRQEQQLQILAVTKTQEQTGTVIKNLVSVFQNAPRWSQVLVKIGEARPIDLALSQVSATQKEVGSGHCEVQFAGTSTSMDAVNQFVERLNTVSLFEHVELAESTRDVESAGLRFVIKARVNFRE